VVANNSREAVSDVSITDGVLKARAITFFGSPAGERLRKSWSIGRSPMLRR